MHKTLLTLTSTTLAILATSCQPQTSTKVVTVEVAKPEKTYNFTKESQGTPIDVLAFDPACTSQRGLGLSNSLINEAYAGIELLRTSTSIQEKSKSHYNADVQTVTAGHPISLCRDASTIPSDSQEGAAIAMKTQADQAFHLYQTVKNGATDLVLPTLGKLDLNAAVKFKVIERNVDKDEKATERTSYFTDNAVFSDGDQPSLISYPLSEGSKKYRLLGGVPMWSINGVFQHEFGHFLFSSIMNEGGRAFANYQDYAQKNPDLHLFHQSLADLDHIAKSPALRSNLAQFVVTQNYVLSALNEGFADLWSYYTLKQPETFFEVSCFTKNRNVSSPAYYNGLPKAWDETVWNKTFNFEMPSRDATQSPTEACAQPQFADNHIVGAAIAHTVDSVFTAAANSHVNRDASVLKAEMAVAWLKDVKSSDEFHDLGGKATLSRILNSAIGTAMKYGKGTDKAALCTAVSSKFPLLVNRWKNPKTDNEDIAGVTAYCSL